LDKSSNNILIYIQNLQVNNIGHIKEHILMNYYLIVIYIVNFRLFNMIYTHNQLIDKLNNDQ